MKQCRKCLASKPLAVFRRDKSSADGFARWCRACHQADRRARPEIYAKYKRNSHLRSAYGIGQKEFEVLLTVAGGRCQICGTSRSKSVRKKSLCVDHNHDTGRIRGLLCDSCNRGIGLLGDSPERIRAAASYLEARNEPKDQR